MRANQYNFLSRVSTHLPVGTNDHELCHSLMTSHNTMNHVAPQKANDHELLSPTDDVTQHHESCRTTEDTGSSLVLK
jgi:hypothetical protein